MKRTILTAAAALLLAIPAVQAQKVNKDALLSKIEKSDEAVADAKEQNGFAFLAYLDEEGFYHTEEGTYPGVSKIGSLAEILRADEPQDSAARAMVRFMLSAEGQQCVDNAGFGPLK